MQAAEKRAVYLPWWIGAQEKEKKKADQSSHCEHIRYEGCVQRKKDLCEQA